MNSDPSRVEKLVREALQHPGLPERQAFLSEACGNDPDLWNDVWVQLRAGGTPQNGDDDVTIKAASPVFFPEFAGEKSGDMIGRYKLLQIIGEGGFGVVWMAEQSEPVRRRVALKIIKMGMDTREVVARFEAERQALAMMDHPSIAKVLDGGATPSGRPYFVMELVRGMSITKYCDDEKLPMAERLALFIQVCHAIQHAHHKGVIHRDIKPTNILVTPGDDGVALPKVIDFGIAKALDRSLTDKTLFTQLEQIIGTPAYMSPEQAGSGPLDIDTRSDVYSLGVLLYEMLTGRPPFDPKDLMSAGIDEMRRVIREVEPPKPSTCLSTLQGGQLTSIAHSRHTEAPKLVSSMKGDLDWIVMKALEKNRGRRYDTANGFAQDVERYLRQEPILARPPSLGYRSGKFIRKYKGPMAAAATIALLIMAGLVAITLLYFQADVARREAVAQTTAADMARREAQAQTDAANIARREALEKNITASSSDRRIAIELFDQIRPREAFAYLARSLEYDPSSSLAAETAVYMLNWGGAGLPLLTLEGHHGDVVSAQFSPDGGRIVTASSDKTARIWDSCTGKVLVNIKPSRYGFFGAQFSSDGRQIMTGGSLDSWKIWDSSDGRLLATQEGVTSSNSVRVSPDGKRLVTAGYGKAQIWDSASGKPLATHEWNKENVTSAQFSPDGRRVVTVAGSSSSKEKTARVWDSANGNLLFLLEGHEGYLTTAQFSPDGSRIVTASGDGTVRVWDSSTGRQLFAAPRSPRTVTRAQFSPDGQRILIGGDFFSPKVWDLATNKLRSLGPNIVANSEQFSPDGQRVVTAEAGGRGLRIWEGATGKWLATLEGHGESVRNARYSPDGQRIVSASSDRTARVWDGNTGLLATMLRDFGEIGSKISVFSPDARRIVTGGRNRPAQVWESASGKLLVTLDREERDLRSAQFSPDGKHLVTTVSDRDSDPDYSKAARVWDSASGRLLFSLEGHKMRLACACFSNDARHVITASEDKTVRLWDGATGKLLATLFGHEDAVNSVQFSPDGERIVSASADNTARVWDRASGRLLVTLQGHEEGVSNARFSGDGRRVVTASRDRTARVWDSATGRMLLTLRGNVGEVTAAEFSPDDRRVITASQMDSNAMQVWDGDKGKLIAKLWVPIAGSVTNAQFSADGQRIVTTDYFGRAITWEGVRCTEKAPSWFGPFLHVVARRKINKEGEMEDLTTPDWLRLRAEVGRAALADKGRYGQIAQWYLLPTLQRPVSPGAAITQGEAADSFLTPDADEYLVRRAYDLNPMHPLVHLALAKLEKNPESARFLMQYGLKRLSQNDSGPATNAEKAAFWSRAARLLRSMPANSALAPDAGVEAAKADKRAEELKQPLQAR